MCRPAQLKGALAPCGIIGDNREQRWVMKTAVPGTALATVISLPSAGAYSLRKSGL